MDRNEIDAVAQSIVESVLGREDYAPLEAGLRKAALTDAYAIQTQVYARLGSQGGLGELGGHKIALTSKAVQELCGVTQPLYGSIYRSQIYPTPASVQLTDYGRLGLEFEVAVQLGQTVPLMAAGNVPHNATTITDYVDVCMPAFELIDDRNADYNQLDAVSLLTDRCWCAGAVIGEPSTQWRNLTLSDCRVELLINGESHATAVAGDSMGHPFNGLAWVANHLAEHGQQLKPGDLVITGSAIKTLFPKSGESYRYIIDGLGEVALDIT